MVVGDGKRWWESNVGGSRQKSGSGDSDGRRLDAAHEQQRRAAAENMKGKLQSAAEAEAEAMGEMARSSKGN